MKHTAVAYYRTSSAANVGADKDSLKRQQEAVQSYAKANRLEVVGEYYDAAVSGSDAIDARDGFVEMLGYLRGNGARTILVESASRFARDLAVQITGHDLLKAEGFDLVPVDAPDHFTNETPTAVMVRNILGAVSQFEKASIVEKLRKARDRKSKEIGHRIEGRKPYKDTDPDLTAAAKRLARKPRGGNKPSLRKVAEALAADGYTRQDGQPLHPQTVANIIQ
jgi:DNA invertase Pin-like site-specific DNA recombinase